MLLTSAVVDPPRIAIRVGTRFVCLSSSFFREWRFRRISAAVTGNRKAFKISDCDALVSDANENLRYSTIDACGIVGSKKLKVPHDSFVAGTMVLSGSIGVSQFTVKRSYPPPEPTAEDRRPWSNRRPGQERCAHCYWF